MVFKVLLAVLGIAAAEYVEVELGSSFALGWEFIGDKVSLTFKVKIK